MLFLPWLAIHLTSKYKFFAKLSPVFICYAVGIILANIPSAKLLFFLTMSINFKSFFPKALLANVSNPLLNENAQVIDIKFIQILPNPIALNIIGSLVYLFTKKYVIVVINIGNA